MRHRGFTLLEILIATGLLGGAFVVILSSAAQSTRMQRMAISRMTMVRLLESKMAKYRFSTELEDGYRASGHFATAPDIGWSLRVDSPSLPFRETTFGDDSANALRITISIRDETGARREVPPLVEWVSPPTKGDS